jgi:4-amino-4-deoxy-L-arabinose transferase-like glycosyltransferase
MTRKGYLEMGYLVLVWFFMTLPLLIMRPLWPIIETRYVSVAWEMWLRHDFLVPYLNGAPYSHKPPLLFWTIQLGWWLFGVNSWWPRVVPSLYTFGSIFIGLRIARLLWPERREISSYLPFILFGCLLLTFYLTFIMFDLLVTFSAALGLYGLVYGLLRKRLPGFLLFGLGIGLGILSKGPVILVVLLPVALSAPWWGKGHTHHPWWTWYGGVAASLLLGTVIALAWALPAAASGGEAYAQALLWKQTADRVVQSFAHQQPWWWYLPLLPLLLFPWPWLPSLWRGARRLDLHDLGVRFCLAWLFLPLLFFSLISGKQVHYLLPIFPAFALLASRLAAEAAFSRRDYLPQVLLFGSLSVIWLVLPVLSRGSRLPSWVQELSPVYGIVMGFCSLAFLFLAKRLRGWDIKAMTTLNALILVVLQAGILHGAARYYDIKPLSGYLAEIQAKAYPIANAAKYEGQYQFLGRLRKPLEVITDEEVPEWLASHKHGRVVRYLREWPREIEQPVEFEQPFRGQYAVVVAAPSP